MFTTQSKRLASKDKLQFFLPPTDLVPNSTYQDTFSFLLLLVPVAGLEGEVDTLLLVFIAGLVLCWGTTFCFFAPFFFFFSAIVFSTSSGGGKIDRGTSSIWLEPVPDLLHQKVLESDQSYIDMHVTSHGQQKDLAKLPKWFTRRSRTCGCCCAFTLLPLLSSGCCSWSWWQVWEEHPRYTMLVSVETGVAFFFFLGGPLQFRRSKHNNTLFSNKKECSRCGITCQQA